MIDYPSKTIGRSLLYYYCGVSRIFLLQIASMGVLRRNWKSCDFRIKPQIWKRGEINCVGGNAMDCDLLRGVSLFSFWPDGLGAPQIEWPICQLSADGIVGTQSQRSELSRFALTR